MYESFRDKGSVETSGKDAEDIKDTHLAVEVEPHTTLCSPARSTVVWERFSLERMNHESWAAKDKALLECSS